MKQKILLLSISLLILSTSTLFSTDRLYIRDPQNWRVGTGTIEDATISVKPNGLYMEVGLYLTISSKGLNFYGQDQLEVEFDFTLPEGTIIKDSWLWVGNEIIRAEIMDKWTASQIYEDIVGRRQDPSILFKHSDTQYELRIYPLSPNTPRKVKITYLVPVQWTGAESSIPLPLHLLNTSKYLLDNYQLIAWPNVYWENPRLTEMPEISLIKKTDQEAGEYLYAEVPNSNHLNFAVDGPEKNGIYLSTFKDKSESFYQLAFLPSAALNLNSSKKVAILIDYDASKTALQPSDMLQLIKSRLLSYFDENDYFNLIFSKLAIHRIRDTWISANKDTIENVFSLIDENTISSYSNLPALLGDGIDFVKENGNDASLLLLSSSDQSGNFEVANQLIEDVLDLMDPTFQIHIGDLQSHSFSYNRIGGRTYYGNEYLYQNLSRLTTANLYRKQYISEYSQVIDNIFQGLGKLLPVFEIHTKLESGVCYGRVNLGQTNGPAYLNKPVMQVGKFDGEFPFLIEASGIYDDEFFTQTYEINQGDIISGDSSLKDLWTGNLIQSFEHQTQTNEVVGQIIDLSMSERILSKYTAFICLEPSLGGQVCYDCFDEEEMVSVEDVLNKTESDSTLINAYPNPFNDQTKIQIKLAGLENTKSVNLKIFNILGELVKDFELSNSLTGNQIDITWNGKNNSGVSVATGTYLLVLSTPVERKTHKLLFMK